MKAFIFALLTLTATHLWAIENYQHLTDFETSATFPGDIIRFFGRDTLWGPIHSNDWIATQNVGGLPAAYDIVSTTRPSFRPGSPIPAMQFNAAPPVFNADYIPFPDDLSYLREAAEERGTFFYIEGHEWYFSIIGAEAFVYHWPEGEQLDTTTSDYEIVPLDITGPVFFVDGKVNIRGVLSPQLCQLLLGCSNDVRLIDNLIIAGTNLTNGRLPAGATSRIAIASEQGIYIANTPENGREGCGGQYANHSRCHIVITAFLFAMGTHFQFEQMNDVNDPYISPVSPDERGNIVLTGGITQKHRGYVHRSNLGGTGYNKVYHYDERLRRWRTGVFEPFNEPEDEFTDAEETLFPSQFLLNVAPNPFNASTTIRFTLPTSSNVLAKVFDVQGREVAQLTDQTYSAGNHVLRFDGSDLATGVYFLRFETLGQIQTRKLMLIK